MPELENVKMTGTGTIEVFKGIFSTGCSWPCLGVDATKANIHMVYDSLYGSGLLVVVNG